MTEQPAQPDPDKPRKVLKRDKSPEWAKRCRRASKAFNERLAREGRQDAYTAAVKAYCAEHGVLWGDAVQAVRPQWGWEGHTAELKRLEAYEAEQQAKINAEVEEQRQFEAQVASLSSEADQLPAQLQFVLVSLRKVDPDKPEDRSKWKVEPKDAPSEGAWCLFTEVVANRTSRTAFITKVVDVLLKLHQSERGGGEERFKDDGRRQLSVIDELLRDLDDQEDDAA